MCVVDVRDFFEPTGSKHLCGLLTKELSQFHPLESNSNIQVIISCISLARTVSKSEDIKGFYVSLFHLMFDSVCLCLQ